MTKGKENQENQENSQAQGEHEIMKEPLPKILDELGANVAKAKESANKAEKAASDSAQAAIHSAKAANNSAKAAAQAVRSSAKPAKRGKTWPAVKLFFVTVGHRLKRHRCGLGWILCGLAVIALILSIAIPFRMRTVEVVVPKEVTKIVEVTKTVEVPKIEYQVPAETTAELNALRTTNAALTANNAALIAENIALKAGGVGMVEPGLIPKTWSSFTGADAMKLALVAFGNIRIKVFFSEGSVPSLADAKVLLSQKPKDLTLSAWIGGIEQARNWPIGLASPNAGDWPTEIFLAKDSDGVVKYYYIAPIAGEAILVDSAWTTRNNIYWLFVLTPAYRK